MFYIVSSNGDLLTKTIAKADAIDELDRILRVDPDATSELAVLEIDARGRRVGDPIRRASPIETVFNLQANGVTVADLGSLRRPASGVFPDVLVGAGRD